MYHIQSKNTLDVMCKIQTQIVKHIYWYYANPN